MSPTPEQILVALDPEQRAVAEVLQGPVCVLAGAGTGKTRAITHRIAYGVVTGAFPAQHMLAVTFTTRAAGELRTRLRALGAGGVQARTFHSAALRQLQFFWPTAIGGAVPRVEASKAPLVAAAAGRAGVRPGPAEVRDLAAEIEWAKVSQVAPADYVAAAAKAGRAAAAGLDPAATAEIYASYEEVKSRRGVIDMEDILLLTVGVLSENADVAERVRRQYRHFVVDEYQDVSPLQQRLLELWLSGRDELCVVGDPSQTIYSFAGATAEFLLGFPRNHPGAAVVRLVRNYRSTPQIVRLANAVLGGAAVQLRSQSADGAEPVLSEYPDEAAEAEGVSGRIAALLAQGFAAAAIAVLFRTNSQSVAYEQALAERGIGFVVRGGEKFFQRPEVKAAMTRLRGAARARAVGADADDPGDDQDLVSQARALLSDAGLVAGRAAGSGAVGERAEALAALLRIAEDLAAAEPSADLTRFVAELDARSADAQVPVLDCVTLASLHSAKGLEWDAVFIVGLVEGMMPISYAADDTAVAEERRLLYVGTTRARRHLELSWALSRAPGGRGSRQPSRFLAALVPVRSPAPPARQAGRVRERAAAVCRVCGKPLIEATQRKLGRCEQCPADLDEALLERLRTWRLQSARSAALPAYCVFTDATLRAIAEARPDDATHLARIPGVGKAKLERYGPDVLAICAGREPAGAS
ncbi:MAG TPA: ATP-dependent DNA helicase UvrD2 [Sporichthyaceae bacterium]|nr:ATP-dependent DNA helicase UvrD2 [Sporichthyaceae bacterium]